jgi:hypothetical protein
VKQDYDWGLFVSRFEVVGVDAVNLDEARFDANHLSSCNLQNIANSGRAGTLGSRFGSSVAFRVDGRSEYCVWLKEGRIL